MRLGRREASRSQLQEVCGVTGSFRGTEDGFGLQITKSENTGVRRGAQPGTGDFSWFG